jgi:hypothetical protein
MAEKKNNRKNKNRSESKKNTGKNRKFPFDKVPREKAWSFFWNYSIIADDDTTKTGPLEISNPNCPNIFLF